MHKKRHIEGEKATRCFLGKAKPVAWLLLHL